jgi:hypothetical protein
LHLAQTLVLLQASLPDYYRQLVTGDPNINDRLFELFDFLELLDQDIYKHLVDQENYDGFLQTHQ